MPCVDRCHLFVSVFKLCPSTFSDVCLPECASSPLLFKARYRSASGSELSYCLLKSWVYALKNVVYLQAHFGVDMEPCALSVSVRRGKDIVSSSKEQWHCVRREVWNTIQPLTAVVLFSEYVNAQELPTDLRSITDRAATTLLWTELFRGPPWCHF